MSIKDKSLIDKAREIHFTEWFLIDDLIDQAESDEARSQLKSIRSSKYHREEYSCGCL